MAEVHDGATLRAALLEIASDFSFTWIAETRLLFDALEPRRFAELHHNPTALLSELTDHDLAGALTPGYLERLARVQERLARDRGEETWWRNRSGPSDLLVAYFSAEFGLDESLPIYSGGLGVLAGDYLKAASELGIPLVGIGLFYRRGYFRQQLDENDRQTEHYPPTDTSRLPLELVPMAPVVELADDSGELVPVRLGIWRVRVGRASLFLIDTQVDGNPDWAVTDTLYGGDRANRLRQEILLGVGGVRALRALGLQPTVFHLNEGHSAFLQLERDARARGGRACRRHEALERLRASTVFTTHTPVPAGNEVFDPRAVRRAPRRARRALRPRPGRVRWRSASRTGRERFGLTPFALRTSRTRTRSRSSTAPCRARCGAALWPEQRVDEVPITSVTNGVHCATWVSPASWRFYASATPGPGCRAGRARGHVAADATLWAAHRSAKERAARAIRRQRAPRPSPRARPGPSLTIGFARRFATYKRASAPAPRPRTAARIARATRAGRCSSSSPARRTRRTTAGKELIQRSCALARPSAFGGRIVFLEDYDMSVARRARAGRRRLAQHAAAPARGERHQRDEGGAQRRAQLLDPRRLVGRGVLRGHRLRDRRRRGVRPTPSRTKRTRRRSTAVLEERGGPALLRARRGRAAARWIALMRESIAELGPRFGTARMAAEYVERLYLPAHEGATRPASRVA